MKNLMKLAVIASLLVGCATNSDIANIQAQIDGLKVETAQTSETAKSAINESNSAVSSAESAKKYSDAAAQLFHQAGYKIDTFMAE